MGTFYIGQSNDRMVLDRARRLYRYLREKGQIPHIILAVSDWNSHFEGDWDVWANSVINRRNAITRERQYDMYVIENVNLGRANWIIMDRAMRNKFPCFHWNGEELYTIKEVQLIDEQDYTCTAICVLGDIA